MNLHELPFYVCHCKKLEERKVLMESELEKIGVTNATWILDYDGDELEDNYEQEILDTSLWDERMNLPTYSSAPPFRVLAKPVASLVMKHREAYRKFLETDSDYALISEDDSIFSDNFVDDFNKIMKELPEGADIVHICGGCCGQMPFGAKEDKYFYKKNESRGTGLYLVSRKAAELIEYGLEKFCGPIDFEINYFILMERLNSYWLHPLLAEQGSEIYGSVLKDIR